VSYPEGGIQGGIFDFVKEKLGRGLQPSQVLEIFVAFAIIDTKVFR